MPQTEGTDMAVVESPRAQRGVSVDVHADGHERSIPQTGWRRLWRVGRVGLVAAAVLVVGVNLARCLPLREADAQGSVQSQPPEPVVKAGQGAEVMGAERAAGAGVGRVFDFSFTDRAGRRATLKDVAGAKATVVALTSASCPLSRKWAPTIGGLARRLSDSGVAVMVVNVNPSDEGAAVDAQWKSAGLDAPGVIAVRDGGLAVAQALDARTTTEVFVFDNSRRLVYRGAPDDQYGIGVAKAAPTVSWLNAAVDGAVSGRAPAVSATTSPGCALEFPVGRAALNATPVTWSGSVASIVYGRCVSCHHAGGIGPFALERYEQVKDHAPMIKRVVSAGLMPPWLAAAPEAGHQSPWANDRSLSALEKESLLSWLSGGMESGDLAAAPKPPVFASEWTIGTPDLVIELPRAVDVKATGVMPYVNVVVPTGITQDRWISAMEVLPTARQAVHHVLVFDEEGSGGGGRGARLRAAASGETGFFAAYVPGGGPQVFPEGFAKKLPANSSFRFQLHYTPTGEATTDRTRIGLRFAKAAPLHEVHTIGLAYIRLNIPPGEADHPESKSITLPGDAVVLAFMPHMHLRGKSFEYVAEQPGREPEVLLSVPRWDFNWQIAYRLKEPKLLVKGTKLTATGRFDNSADNPSNPDATKRVRWGQQSTDEMMIGYVEYYLPGEKP